MVGNIVLPSSGPTTPTHATTRQYVDDKVAGAGYLPIGGGTLSGSLSVTGNLTTTGFIAGNAGRVFSQLGSNPAFILGRVGSGVVSAYTGIFTDASDNSVHIGQMNSSGVPTVNFARITQNNIQTGSSFQFQFLTPSSDISQILWHSDNANLQYNNATKDLQYFTFDGANFQYRRSLDNALINNSGPIFATNFSSDIRMKSNVVPMSYSIDTLMAMEVIEFDWILWDGSTGAHDCGFSAQDVKLIYDEAVVVQGIPLFDGSGGPDDPNPTLGMKDSTMIALLVKCMQNVNTRLTALEP
jgi:hypothetical protein